MAGCRVRKDSVKFVDTLVTVSPEFAKAHKAEMTKYFTWAFDFLKERIGENTIFSAVYTWMKRHLTCTFASSR